MQDVIKKYQDTLQQKDDPVIFQIHPYKPISKDNKIKDEIVPNNVEPTKGPNKGKQKVVGIQINEPMVIEKNNLVMSKIDLELEEA